MARRRSGTAMRRSGSRPRCSAFSTAEGRCLRPPVRAGQPPGGSKLRYSRTVVSLSFAPKDRVFFDLLKESGQNAVRSAKLLAEMLDTWPDGSEGLNREILKSEQEGDRI